MNLDLVKNNAKYINKKKKINECDKQDNEDWCTCCGGKDGQDSNNTKQFQRYYLGNRGKRNSCSKQCDIERKKRTTFTTKEQEKLNECKQINKKLDNFSW